MSKTIAQIKRLMAELGMSSEAVVQRLNLTCAYQVGEKDFIDSMEGVLNTPKAKRVRIDALRVLNDTLARRLRAGLAPKAASSHCSRTPSKDISCATRPVLI